jgi:hypothetical protein
MDAAIQQLVKAHKSGMKEIFATDWRQTFVIALGIIFFVIGLFNPDLASNRAGTSGLLLIALGILMENKRRWKKLESFLENEFKN